MPQLRARTIKFIAVLSACICVHLRFPLNAAPANETRLHQHKVSSSRSPAPEPGAENEIIPSLVEGLESADDWYQKRRPELLAYWTQILGKLRPADEDNQWFGDITQGALRDKQEFEKYTRYRIDLPMEIDFEQPHLLLLPRNQGPGPFPAVIAWTSSTPDYAAP